ncbi:MAG: DUF3224 domain-containing protein [Actinomycetota bacterium]|jgi:hypothetical protein
MGTLIGTFEITSMGEDTLRELGGSAKLTHANGTQHFSGGIEGDGSVDWLMCYVDGGGASYVGLQRIEGSVDGRKGTFVIEAVGRFDGGASRGSWAVIEGSGTGELEGITGEGRFEAPGGPNATYSLEYRLP